MKVLSIDFDYIMSPCIKMYNHISTGKENPTVLWNYIEHELAVENFLNYDANSLLSIAKVIKENVKTGAIFIPIVEHDEIIKNLPNDNELEIVNIDFHHDILYRPELITEMTDFNKYNCSNWVGYLQIQNRLKSYTWIKAPQSDLFDPDLLDIDFQIKGRSDIDSLENDFDYVFLCLSPQWVPYKFQHLYDLIVKMVKED